MSIDHIWDNLTDEERADLEAYIDEAVELLREIISVDRCNVGVVVD